MCRHLAYVGPAVPLADVVTAQPGGLYEQSWAPRRQRHGTVNADGFGIGWYPYTGTDGSPARYRRAVPIWADANLPDLARTIRSGMVLAAVRDATPGTSQDEAAAAPFAGDRWLFSHNGAIRDWERLPDDLGVRVDAADLLGLEARCDSALLWALVLHRLRAGEPAGGVLADVTRRVAAVRPGARLNLLLTDGRTVAATRYGDSLWYRPSHGDPPHGDPAPGGPPHGDPVPGGPPHGGPARRGPSVAREGLLPSTRPGTGLSRTPTGPGGAAPWPDGVVVASEPDGRPGWREAPEGSLLLATRTSVTTLALAPARAAVERTRPA